MGLEEHWIIHPEFKDYAVSDCGRVMNVKTDLLKNPSTNQQGILMVNFSHNRMQYVRSVALMVSEMFVRRDPFPSHFDTPIHLDGNKSNCDSRNLTWRPRWFAVRYHQQFDPWQRENRPGFRKFVRLIDTDEIFPTSWDAAIKYGLLDFDIFINTINGKEIFPFNFKFEELDR